MKTRVITGILMGLFFIPVFVIGSWLLYAVLGLMSVFASYEMMNMIKKGSSIPNSVFGFAAGYNLIFYLGFIYGIRSGLAFDIILPFIVGLVLVGSIFMVFVDEMKFDLFAKVVLAILYPVLGFSSLAIIRDEGLALLGLLFVITVSTDVFAYFVGINLGKHKLAPKISPKKSIEGSLGGLFFAGLFSVLYVWIINYNDIQIDVALWVIGVIAIFASLMAQVGDLVASKMKRTYGIKDFSQIFPGHGGIMDRFDSSIFAAMIFVMAYAVGLI